MPTASLRWVATAPHAIHIREWPGHSEHLVFDERSGDLHLLSPAAVRVLRRTIAGPCDMETLLVASEGSLDHVHEIVQSLDELGLIGPSTS